MGYSCQGEWRHRFCARAPVTRIRYQFKGELCCRSQPPSKAARKLCCQPTALEAQGTESVVLWIPRVMILQTPPCADRTDIAQHPLARANSSDPEQTGIKWLLSIDIRPARRGSGLFQLKHSTRRGHHDHKESWACRDSVGSVLHAIGSCSG